LCAAGVLSLAVRWAGGQGGMGTGGNHGQVTAGATSSAEAFLAGMCGLVPQIVRGLLCAAEGGLTGSVLGWREGDSRARVVKLTELLVLKLAMQVGVRCEFEEGDRLCRGRGVTGSSGSVLG
jgi:hypothetical protein